MNKEEILNEIVRERQVELDIIKDSGYFPEESESSKLNMEKITLRRRLNEIETEENKVDPAILEAKKRALHFAVMRHKIDAALSNRQLDLTFPQMQCAGETYPFRNKK